MAIFDFDRSHYFGRVREVDTRRVTVLVGTDEDLRKARVGQLAAIRLSGAVETWLIGVIEKVIKSVAIVREELDEGESQTLLEGETETVVNTVRLTLVGSAAWDAARGGGCFTRSLSCVPEIEAECYVLRDQQLEDFMSLLALETDREHSLELGTYALDESATAFLDGNRLFQRHAALLGSTGSGKSWTVASILERAAALPSASLVVLDLHGEYSKLTYARHLRVPGPEDLGKSSDELLYLPYWLLNTEEMLAMFIDRSEFSAHNQVMAFQDAIVSEKKQVLEGLDKREVLAAFTLDSPVPFSLAKVVEELERLNVEMVPGQRGEKQGPFHGQFARLIPRLRSKMTDKRYGFLLQAPDVQHEYDAMAKTVAKLMDYVGEKSQVKVIDFSEVPSDILPVIIGLVARLVYQVQFWTDAATRRPLAIVCDEAHLYLPKKEGKNPIEQRSIESFERIAKEGRKYGVSLLVVSQRPSDVSPTILSQCNNVIALRLSNGDDQLTVRKLMPESLETLLDVLPVMDVGEALVVGDSVLLPSRIKVKPPREKPLSATIDFWTCWQETPSVPDFSLAVESMRRQSRSS